MRRNSVRLRRISSTSRRAAAPVSRLVSAIRASSPSIVPGPTCRGRRARPRARGTDRCCRAPRHRRNRRRRPRDRAPAGGRRMASAPKASRRNCSGVKPANSLTPDRMRMSSSSAMTSPNSQSGAPPAMLPHLSAPIRQGTSLYPPLSVTRISALEGSRSIFWRRR